MPVITVQDVRDVVSLNASDLAIELQIEVVNDKIGACLDSKYTPAVAKAIAIYTVAHFAEKGAASSVGGVRSRTWADGSSESYDTGGSRSNSSSFWDAAYQLDSEGCLSAFEDSIPEAQSSTFIVTGRTSSYFSEPQ